MRLLNKTLPWNLSDISAFTYLNGQPFLIGFQEIRTPATQKLKGFFLECYEHKFNGKMVGYLYASIREDVLVFDEKDFVRNNPYIQSISQTFNILIPRRWRDLYSLMGLRISKNYSSKNHSLKPSERGFGKFLVKTAVEIGLEKYQLRKLSIFSTKKSLNFYYKIFKLPQVKTLEITEEFPKIEIDLVVALKRVSGATVGTKFEPK
jgi:hypothetical protein